MARLDDGRIVAVRERNVIATVVPPGARGRDALPPPRGDDGRRARRPRRGRRPAPAPHAPRAAGTVGDVARSTGKVRAARLTDLAALGRAVAARAGRRRGDAVARAARDRAAGSACSSLFRLPLGAFTPHDVMYVFDRDGHVAGLLRAERESSRDEWTVVELDAVGDMDAGDVRFRLVQHLLRDGAKRGAVRFHVACADADDNVELFMQAGSSATATSASCSASPASRCPRR